MSHLCSHRRSPQPSHLHPVRSYVCSPHRSPLPSHLPADHKVLTSGEPLEEATVYGDPVWSWNVEPVLGPLLRFAAPSGNVSELKWRIHIKVRKFLVA